MVRIFLLKYYLMMILLMILFIIVLAISKLSGCSLTTRGIDQLAITTVEGLLGYLKIEGL